MLWGVEERGGVGYVRSAAGGLGAQSRVTLRLEARDLVLDGGCTSAEAGEPSVRIGSTPIVDLGPLLSLDTMPLGLLGDHCPAVPIVRHERVARRDDGVGSSDSSCRVRGGPDRPVVVQVHPALVDGPLGRESSGLLGLPHLLVRHHLLPHGGEHLAIVVGGPPLVALLAGLKGVDRLGVGRTSRRHQSAAECDYQGQGMWLHHELSPLAECESPIFLSFS